MNEENKIPVVPITVPDGLEAAFLAAGCFWCTEAVFGKVKGVLEVKSGYSGGHIPSPTYRQVTSGITGHAECIKILFDPDTVSYRELLEVFWYTHDPTTLNRQGADVGPQYRSSVFYVSKAQKDVAESFKKALNEENVFGKPVVTEITAYWNFYEAEDYHDNYYALNANQPYCQYVIRPKIDKFLEYFPSFVKE